MFLKVVLVVSNPHYAWENYGNVSRYRQLPACGRRGVAVRRGGVVYFPPLTSQLLETATF